MKLHGGGVVSGWAQSAQLPQKKHSFLSVFHIGCLKKIYLRAGSAPQINVKFIVKSLERQWQRGQGGETGLYEAGVVHSLGEKTF
jgi:hypothetical protein